MRGLFTVIKGIHSGNLLVMAHTAFLLLELSVFRGIKFHTASLMSQVNKEG